LEIEVVTGCVKEREVWTNGLKYISLVSKKFENHIIVLRYQYAKKNKFSYIA